MYNSQVVACALALVGAVQSLPATKRSGECTDPPSLNSASIDLIKSFEGFRGSPYSDPTGNPTVGYGHLCDDSSCSDVDYDFPMSEAEGEALLQSDLKTYESCIANAVVEAVKLTDNQYGALTSWTYNEGCGAAESSTLVSRLNDGESVNTVIAEELPQWVYSGGEKLEGLERRRDAEVDLAKTASSTIAVPC